MNNNPEIQETDPLFRMIGAVTPVLVPYTKDRIVDELWSRPGLAARERAIVSVAVLVSRNANGAYVHYLNKALDSGVAPAELSELLAHLAFYTGFAYAFGAVGVLKGIFDERGIGVDQLPGTSPTLLATEDVLPDAAERTAFLAANVAPASEALRHFTDELLHGEAWRRPGLAARDRALATIASHAAQGQSALLPTCLAHALKLGVTEQEIGELLAHVAFYSGWGNALQAAEVVTRYYESRRSA
ncbi:MULTISPECIES: carboxymuconolactone decarboxylase family protein [Pseudomonadota]|jgi:4-carboxymuconolactone decarboxylase|uniref:Carboxymuconolactone decarboxylase family protein n=3 Tax=Pseudomonadota TaxID=1224 RepID=A0A454TZG3_9RALS|nr:MULTISPECIES: carboxymuconolactone decarboxylase family protein [Pseudomonadota]MBH1379279.1 carboxymuconolactone decarboxylase family protein [Stenotrophomonas maltophilia]NKB10812.1 carboxymuconolactone decarboxylase family protein [Ralstonia solanacearum]AWP59119.1 carboxymuconolactone decarboxylase [Bordetella bronchiseptica]MBH1395341.1 carboxymuconolactone decarboxylase family protein [Stenotrophomonas maltophilia]MBH1468124.1 carboxymuconolactone decarboxylase family protein [Stenotr